MRFVKKEKEHNKKEEEEINNNNNQKMNKKTRNRSEERHKNLKTMIEEWQKKCSVRKKKRTKNWVKIKTLIGKQKNEVLCLRDMNLFGPKEENDQELGKNWNFDKKTKKNGKIHTIVEIMLQVLCLRPSRALKSLNLSTISFI